MRDLYRCAADLEDAVWLSNKDKARASEDLKFGIEKILEARKPCGVFKRLIRHRDCIT